MAESDSQQLPPVVDSQAMIFLDCRTNRVRGYQGAASNDHAVQSCLERRARNEARRRAGAFRAAAAMVLRVSNAMRYLPPLAAVSVF